MPLRYLQSPLAVNAEGLKGQGEREVMLLVATRERKQQSSQGTWPSEPCGPGARERWPRTVFPGRLKCLFFVFIAIYVHHQHKCEKFRENKCFLIKVNSCDFRFRYF